MIMVKYGLPFRAPAGGWDSPRKAYISSNALCGCTPFNHWRPADLIDRWANVTQVRKQVFNNGTDASAGVTNTSNNDPFARKVRDQYDGVHSSPACSTLPAGECGPWLVGGDLNGLSSQEVQDTVNDIMACGGGAATKDHNCYATDTTKKDLRSCHKLGGKWAIARKFWQGRLGIKDRNEPTPKASRTCVAGSFYDDGVGVWTTAYESFWTTAPQNHYLRAQCDVTCVCVDHLDDGLGTVVTNNSEYHSNSSIGRYTGINSRTGSNSSDFPTGSFRDTGPDAFILVQKDWNDWIAYFTGWRSGLYGPGYHIVDAGGGVYELWIDASGGTPAWKLESVGPLTRSQWEWNSVLNTTVLTFTESVSVSNTGAHYTSTNTIWHDYGAAFPITTTIDATFALSDPYTAAQHETDLLTASAAWDFTDDHVYPWRTDMELANTPLICCDEVGPTEPSLDYVSLMDNYALAYDSVTGWPQRAWHDPHDYVWLYNGNSVNPPGSFAGAGGTTLVTGRRTGELITHNPAGYDRHFWFAAENWAREYVSASASWVWTLYTTGAKSNGSLPESALRWLGKTESQFDGEALVNSRGVFPQFWFHEQGSVGWVMKYIEAKLPWPSVNFARPYGLDKFAVDQATVCAVLPAGGPVIVRRTGNAIDPTQPGGLAGGDKIMIGGDGIYHLVSIATYAGATDWTSEQQYQLTVGDRLSDIPAGSDIGEGYLGKMRWWDAPPFGLEAVTATVAGGTTTLEFSAALDCWLTATQSVDLYAATTNASGVSVPAASALASAVTLTKTDSTHGTLSGSYGSAAFVVPHGMNPCFDDAGPKGDFVKSYWTFNQRLASDDYTGTAPTWWEGISGVISGSVVQAAVPFQAVNVSVVGGVTSGSPEAFPNQNLVNVATGVGNDDRYGSHWQGEIATTMPDPFYQTPFKPDLAGDVDWREDDGSGQEDDLGTVPPIKYFPFHPLVEALRTIPSSGWAGTSTPSLPTGIKLGFDTSAYVIPPQKYPHGIPIGNTAGAYGGIWRPWGFYTLAKATIAGSGRFAGNYAKFVM